MAAARPPGCRAFAAHRDAARRLAEAAPLGPRRLALIESTLRLLRAAAARVPPAALLTR